MAASLIIYGGCASAIAVVKFLGESFLLSYIVINLHLVVVFEVAGAHTCSVVRWCSIVWLRPVRVRSMLLVLSHRCFALCLELHLHWARQKESLLVASLSTSAISSVVGLTATRRANSAIHAYLIGIHVIKLPAVACIRRACHSRTGVTSSSSIANRLVSITFLRINLSTVTATAYHRLNN